MQQKAAGTGTESGGKKASDPRKHHYVPVFYQKNFANEKGLLWAYDRQRETYKELHPLVVCFERDLYAVKPENKPRDMRVERDLLSIVDGLGSRGIRAFQDGRQTSKAEQEVAFLIAFQWTRVPTVSRDIRVTYAKAIEEVSRIAFANVERAKTLMERYAHDMDEDLKVTPESMVEAVQGKQFEIVATETAFLSHMMQQAMSLTEVLLGLDWEMLIAPEDTSFIICDCPVVVVPPKGSNQVDSSCRVRASTSRCRGISACDSENRGGDAGFGKLVRKTCALSI